MKKLGVIFLNIVFLSSVGCASSMTGGARKDAPTAVDKDEAVRIRTERMLMLQLKHI